LGLFSAAFLYGVGVGVYQWPPFSVLKAFKHALVVDESVQPADRRTNGAAYQLTTYRQSYYKLDSGGTLELQRGLPFRSEDTYRFERTIRPTKTAIVIMDPWVDMPSTHLNEYYGQIVESRIMPLVSKSLKRGHPIIVLTNDPDTVDYNTNIHPELAALSPEGKISILYHQDFSDEEFATYLRSKGIDTLIYIGFSSNMCIIGRRMGMIPMVQNGFRLFFVPEASAAVEYPNTWDNQSIHHATTKIISQWIAEIIDYDEFMHAGVTNR
jgi:nicotinamidase-related amidase